MKNRTLTTRRARVGSRHSLVVAIAATLLGSAALAASAAPVAATFAVAHPTTLERGDAVVGALPMNHPIRISVAMKMRNKPALDAFIANLRTSRVSGKPVAPMTREQVLANHAPTVQQAQAVADYLTSQGFTHVTVSKNRMRVYADATAAIAGRTFGTSFRQVRTHEGRIAYANVDEARLPGLLADRVDGVLGLEDVHYSHVFNRGLSSGTSAVIQHYPLDYASIYDATSTAMPTGVTIGILSNGDLTPVLSNLNAFTSAFSLPTVTTSTVTVDATSTDTSNEIEWELDSQNIVGSAGGQVGGLIFYNMKNLSFFDTDAAFNQAVSDDVVKVVNVSLGVCETSAKTGNLVLFDDPILAMGAAQGQTFSIATGDKSADECQDSSNAPQWASASQYVTGVAGTTLDATTTTFNSESVWFTSSSVGTGGSESLFEPKPSWQTLWGGTRRNSADVAFDADPASGSHIYYQGIDQCCVGGTSLASPIFVGLWARVLQANPTIGFASPVIYTMAQADFHDVTTGSNGFSAGPGYDEPTGRGSMDFAVALTDITTNHLGNQPPVAGFTYLRTGLGVRFTDISTDDAGTAGLTYSWDFGDASPTSTAQSPSHTYAANGTYTVNQTVTDQVGASTTKTHNVAVASNDQLLKNTGFESTSPGPWVLTAGVLQNFPANAHAGSRFAELGFGGLSSTDRATQAVTIPAGHFNATLQFYLWVTSSESTTTAVHDRLNVDVLDAGGALLATLGTFTNLDKSGGYVVHSFDMTPYIGQSVKIRFTGINNAAAPTTWLLDDVTLRAH